MVRSFLVLVLVGFLIGLSLAQENVGSQIDAAGKTSPERSAEDHAHMPGMDMSNMPGMDHSKMGNMGGATFIQNLLHHASSGTSAEPNSSPHAMMMHTTGKWMLMLHGSAFLTMQQQTGPRAADKTFSTNWLMPMAQRKLGKGTLTMRGMFSLEPATITRRYFPELFQVGETAYGRPIVDGQHPHDFFMELAVLYDLPIGDRSLLSFYAAPIGDPALGPTAYPHRSSAMEDPLATLGHHQQDSTHIASDVLTMGITHRIFRIEASGFHGREPDESRWNIDFGSLDSWSVRLTANLTKNWSGQYSYGRIHSPEELNPEEDQDRMTASLMYNRPLFNGNWSNTLVWGRTESVEDGFVYYSYLVESLLVFKRQNNIWTRIENVDRSSDLLLKNQFLPVNFVEQPIGRVQGYSFGYDRNLDWIRHLVVAPGIQITFYGVPDCLQSLYGSRPLGVALFVRIRPVGKGQ